MIFTAKHAVVQKKLLDDFVERLLTSILFLRSNVYRDPAIDFSTFCFRTKTINAALPIQRQPGHETKITRIQISVIALLLKHQKLRRLQRQPGMSRNVSNRPEP
jgi:hypothetical protein